MDTKHQNPASLDTPDRSRTRQSRSLLSMLWHFLRGLLVLGMLLQIVLTFTPLTEQLFMGLDATSEPKTADVIVCLGGDDARIANAADLYHRRYASRIVVSNLPGAAEDMRDMLVRWGVPTESVLVDNASFVTADHPAGVARITGLNPETSTFLIVTSLEHSRRSAACFRKAGYKNITLYAWPNPLRRSASTAPRYRWRFQCLPRMIYEYVALVDYWIHDRI